MGEQLSQSELERIKRVSDQLVTAHSVLRDRYARRAFFIDITILGSTLWLTAMAFVNPEIGVELTPHGLSKDLWLGLLSVVAFFLSIVQIRVDWKGKEYAHARACEAYSSVKRETVNLLAQEKFDELEYKRILDKYESAGTLSIPIPEAEFNTLKSKHKIKVEISRYLDDKPAASPTLLKIKLWCRDNIRGCNEKQ
jgi:hypothetical protein